MVVGGVICKTLKPMRKSGYFYRNGLSLVFLSLFPITLAAQAIAGWKEHNQEFCDHW